MSDLFFPGDDNDMDDFMTDDITMRIPAAVSICTVFFFWFLITNWFIVYLIKYSVLYVEISLLK